MTELFSRRWRLQVGSVLIDATGEDEQPLDVEFEVEKSTAREPNAVSISVYNLNRSHRDQLKNADRVGVILEAGYADGELTTIFNGDLRDVESAPDGLDVVTKLEGEDGGNAYREARLQRSFSAGTPVLTVLRAAVEAMGIGEGNLRELSGLTLEGAGNTYPEGAVLSGPAREEVDGILRSCGYQWSIQDGNFQLQRRGQPIRETATVLSPETGLLGSPSRSKPERGRPRVTNAQCLLIPGLYPGRVILLRSRGIEGQFMARKVKFVGSTFATEWGAELELVEY